MVMTMLDKDRGDATPDVMTRGKVIKHMTCWRTWCYGLCFMNSTLPVSRPCRRSWLERDADEVRLAAVELVLCVRLLFACRESGVHVPGLQMDDQANASIPHP